MSRLSRTNVPIIAFVGLMVSGPVLGCKEGLPLAEVLSKAARLVSQGSPRVAISNCYSRFLTDEAFDRATIRQQERFLYEFTDACLLAARKSTLPREEALQFLEQGIMVAKRYVDWYKSLQDTHRQDLHRTSQDRIEVIVFFLGDLYDRSEKRTELLEAFEEIANLEVAFFGPKSAKLWEAALRSYPDHKRTRTDEEIKQLLKADEVYLVHWQIFRDFADKLSNSKGKESYGRVTKAGIKNIVPFL